MFFKKENKKVQEIYQNIVKISRSKFFYLKLKVKDDFETRFDLIIFHAFIIFYYYKKLNIKNSKVSQDLFDLMFGDFENNLREMGFGDIAVNKKMKVFISAFYGRIAQYSKSIEIFESNGDKSLIQSTILNNIYKGNRASNNKINFFVDYMISNIQYFVNSNETENLKDNFNFIIHVDEKTIID